METPGETSLCCPQQDPRLLAVLWGYTDVMKAPARCCPDSLGSPLSAPSAANSLALHSSSCSDVHGVTAAHLKPQGKLWLLPLGCLEEPSCCWADWERWAHSRVGTGIQCATPVWRCVQMGSLFLVSRTGQSPVPMVVLLWVFQAALPRSAGIVGSTCPPQFFFPALHPPEAGEMFLVHLGTPQKPFLYSSCLSSISPQCFVPIEQCCSLGD